MKKLLNGLTINDIFDNLPEFNIIYNQNSARRGTEKVYKREFNHESSI